MFKVLFSKHHPAQYENVTDVVRFLNPKIITIIIFGRFIFIENFSSMFLTEISSYLKSQLSRAYMLLHDEDQSSNLKK